jgi:Uma2 family endonuclease
LLVIEVSDASARYDRDVKMPLYARSGIEEVWLVDLRERRLVRHREPVNAWYRRIDQPDLISPIEIAAVDVRIDLKALFA